jgi:hypothetical protein
MPEVPDNRIPPGSFEQPDYVYNPPPAEIPIVLDPVGMPARRQSGSNWSWITACIFLVALVVAGILFFPSVMERLQTSTSKAGVSNIQVPEIPDIGAEVSTPANMIPATATSTSAESPIIYYVPSTPSPTQELPAPISEEIPAAYTVTAPPPQQPVFPRPESYTPSPVDTPFPCESVKAPVSCTAVVPPPPVPGPGTSAPVNAPFPCQSPVPPPPVPQPPCSVSPQGPSLPPD